METKLYTVTRIEGEYAYLRQDNQECDEELFIAMALLPPEVDIGTRLKYELFEYSII
ncbi:MAG: chorismate--pyruvate lyase [Clostridia bacterium]|nr:chorismate--pyruvate lyase [Clostridia bacterium]